MEEQTRFAVIMAGGAGERFWPLSRAARPKQLLCLTDPDKSMLAEAVDRLTPLIPAERIFVITSRALVAPIREAGLGLPDENIVGEPAKRNTSGALAWITAHILARWPTLAPEAIGLAIVTADHRIGAPESFRAMIDAALTAAGKEKALVTCGITPTHAETGFGYVQASTAGVGEAACKVVAFHEKPDRARAEGFLAAGNFYWNSGMFFWTVGAFLAELKEASPALATTTLAMRDALAAGDAAKAEEIFHTIEDISIDYALMERAKNVLMVPSEFPWADVGSWSSIECTLEKDEHDNAAMGDVFLHDSRGCIVYNDATSHGITVGVVGLTDVVVVTTPDAVLVVPKDRAQDVRHIVAALKKRGAPQV